MRRRSLLGMLAALLPTSWVKVKAEPVDDHQKHIEAHTSAMRDLGEPPARGHEWYQHSNTIYRVCRNCGLRDFEAAEFCVPGPAWNVGRVDE